MFRDEPEEVCMRHTGRQNVGLINHVPCRGNLSALALLVANIANLEPIDWDVFTATEEMDLPMPEPIDDIEAEEQMESEHFEPEPEKPWFKRMGIDEGKFRAAMGEAPEPENESQANLNMALAELKGVRIVYETDFKEEYPDVVSNSKENNHE